MRPVVLLAQLNDADLAVDALKSRLAQIAEALREPAALVAARRALAEAEAALAGCQATMADAERAQQTATNKLAQAEQQLYGGKVRNPRELEDAERNVHQGGLFDLNDTGMPADVHYVEAPRWTEREQLLNEKQALGFFLSGHPFNAYAGQVAAFARFTDELLTWNERFNLTAVTDREQVEVRHYLDSLSLLPALASLDGVPLATVTGRMARTMSGPKVRLGTKWPSITST